MRASLGVALGVGCLLLALRNVDGHELLAVARAAHFGWIFVAAILLLVSYAARAVRWSVILGETDRAWFVVLYWSTSLGYFLNSILPARAGDVARSAAAARGRRANTARLLASTVIERVVDAATLALALALALPFVPTLPAWLVSVAQVVGAMSLALIVVLGVLGRRAQAGPVGPLPGRSNALRTAVRAFGSGLLLIDTLGRATRVMVSTLGVWCVDTCLAMALARGFDVHLSAAESLALLAAFGLASAAPSTPGYLGVFQAVAVGVLVPFGASREEAIAIATTLQLVTLVTSILGTIGGGFAVRRLPAPATSESPIGSADRFTPRIAGPVR